MSRDPTPGTEMHAELAEAPATRWDRLVAILEEVESDRVIDAQHIIERWRRHSITDTELINVIAMRYQECNSKQMYHVQNLCVLTDTFMSWLRDVYHELRTRHLLRQRKPEEQMQNITENNINNSVNGIINNINDNDNSNNKDKNKLSVNYSCNKKSVVIDNDIHNNIIVHGNTSNTPNGAGFAPQNKTSVSVSVSTEATLESCSAQWPELGQTKQSHVAPAQPRSYVAALIRNTTYTNNNNTSNTNSASKDNHASTFTSSNSLTKEGTSLDGKHKNERHQWGVVNNNNNNSNNNNTSTGITTISAGIQTSHNVIEGEKIEVGYNKQRCKTLAKNYNNNDKPNKTVNRSNNCNSNILKRSDSEEDNWLEDQVPSAFTCNWRFDWDGTLDFLRDGHLLYLITVELLRYCPQFAWHEYEFNHLHNNMSINESENGVVNNAYGNTNNTDNIRSSMDKNNSNSVNACVADSGANLQSNTRSVRSRNKNKAQQTSSQMCIDKALSHNVINIITSEQVGNTHVKNVTSNDNDVYFTNDVINYNHSNHHHHHDIHKTDCEDEGMTETHDGNMITNTNTNNNKNSSSSSYSSNKNKQLGESSTHLSRRRFRNRQHKGKRLTLLETEHETVEEVEYYVHQLNMLCEDYLGWDLSLHKQEHFLTYGTCSQVLRPSNKDDLYLLKRLHWLSLALWRVVNDNTIVPIPSRVSFILYQDEFTLGRNEFMDNQEIALQIATECSCLPHNSHLDITLVDEDIMKIKHDTAHPQPVQFRCVIVYGETYVFAEISQLFKPLWHILHCVMLDWEGINWFFEMTAEEAEIESSVLCPDVQRSYGTREYHHHHHEEELLEEQQQQQQRNESKQLKSNNLYDEYNDEANDVRRYHELKHHVAREPLVARESDRHRYNSEYSSDNQVELEAAAAARLIKSSSTRSVINNSNSSGSNRNSNKSSKYSNLSTLTPKSNNNITTPLTSTSATSHVHSSSFELTVSQSLWGAEESSLPISRLRGRNSKPTSIPISNSDSNIHNNNSNNSNNSSSTSIYNEHAEQNVSFNKSFGEDNQISQTARRKRRTLRDTSNTHVANSFDKVENANKTSNTFIITNNSNKGDSTTATTTTTTTNNNNSNNNNNNNSNNDNDDNDEASNNKCNEQDSNMNSVVKNHKHAQINENKTNEHQEEQQQQELKFKTKEMSNVDGGTLHTNAIANDSTESNNSFVNSVNQIKMKSEVVNKLTEKLSSVSLQVDMSDKSSNDLTNDLITTTLTNNTRNVSANQDSLTDLTMTDQSCTDHLEIKSTEIYLEAEQEQQREVEREESKEQTREPVKEMEENQRSKKGEEEEEEEEEQQEEELEEEEVELNEEVTRVNKRRSAMANHKRSTSETSAVEVDATEYLHKEDTWCNREYVNRAIFSATIVHETQERKIAIREHRFRINGKPIGKGAFGAVYMALDLETGVVVAVKQSRYSYDRSRTNLSWREVQTWSMLPTHPHVITFYGATEEVETHQLLLVLEYASGGSILSMYRNFGPVPEHIFHRHAREVALGLQHLHSHNVIHGDVKPENVLTRSDGSVAISDFGCSRLPVGSTSNVANTTTTTTTTTTTNTTTNTTISQEEEEEQYEYNDEENDNDVKEYEKTQNDQFAKREKVAVVAERSPDMVTNQVFGTVAYMAPEVICSKPVLKSDVWAYACTLMQLWLNELPWSGGEDPLDVHDIIPLMYRIATKNTIPFTEAEIHSVPRWLQKIAYRSFEREVENRCNMAEILSILTEYNVVELEL